MSKKPLRQPKKRKGVEIFVKRSFRLSFDTDCTIREGMAIFANRKGYRYLSEYFRWLAKRPLANIDGDPGDHVHLTPHSPLTDDMGFTFDTLTPSNRKEVLQNAKAKKRFRRHGTPIAQFAEFVADIVQTMRTYLKNDDEFRDATISDISHLIDVLEQKRAELQSFSSENETKVP